MYIYKQYLQKRMRISKTTKIYQTIPIESMYGIFTYIYQKIQPFMYG